MKELSDKFNLALLKTLEFVLLNNRQDGRLFWCWESDVDFENMYVSLRQPKVEEETETNS